jgi:hypothetical protein
VYNKVKDRDEGKDEIMSNVQLEEAQKLLEALSESSVNHLEMAPKVKQFRNEFELSNDAWAEVISSAMMEYGDWDAVSLLIDDEPRLEPIKILAMVMKTGDKHFVQYFLEGNEYFPEGNEYFLKELCSSKWMQILRMCIDTNDLDMLQPLLNKAPPGIIDCVEMVKLAIHTDNEGIMRRSIRISNRKGKIRNGR